MKSVMVVHDMAPTVLPTGNDEDVFFVFSSHSSGLQWTYQPGSHRKKVTQDFHPPSFCGACLNFSREKDSAIPFPRRP